MKYESAPCLDSKCRRRWCSSLRASGTLPALR